MKISLCPDDDLVNESKIWLFKSISCYLFTLCLQVSSCTPATQILDNWVHINTDLHLMGFYSKSTPNLIDIIHLPFWYHTYS